MRVSPVNPFPIKPTVTICLDECECSICNEMLPQNGEKVRWATQMVDHSAGHAAVDLMLVHEACLRKERDRAAADLIRMATPKAMEILTSMLDTIAEERRRDLDKGDAIT